MAINPDAWMVARVDHHSPSPASSDRIPVELVSKFFKTKEVKTQILVISREVFRPQEKAKENAKEHAKSVMARLQTLRQ